MSEPITLASLESEYYTQKRIQDENVKYGLARCQNETKEKSLLKLRNHLHSIKHNESCEIKLDDDKPLIYVFPLGKTKGDLVAHIYKFFNDVT